jgi:hypothetical protein
MGRSDDDAVLYGQSEHSARRAEAHAAHRRRDSPSDGEWLGLPQCAPRAHPLPPLPLQGLSVGQWGIASSNKCICHVRLKRSGAGWYEVHSNQRLALRCGKYNGTLDQVVGRHRQLAIEVLASRRYPDISNRAHLSWPRCRKKGAFFLINIPLQRTGGIRDRKGTIPLETPALPAHLFTPKLLG